MLVWVFEHSYCLAILSKSLTMLQRCHTHTQRQGPLLGTGHTSNTDHLKRALLPHSNTISNTSYMAIETLAIPVNLGEGQRERDRVSYDLVKPSQRSSVVLHSHCIGHQSESCTNMFFIHTYTVLIHIHHQLSCPQQTQIMCVLFKCTLRRRGSLTFMPVLPLTLYQGEDRVPGSGTTFTTPPTPPFGLKPRSGECRLGMARYRGQ